MFSKLFAQGNKSKKQLIATAATVLTASGAAALWQTNNNNNKIQAEDAMVYADEKKLQERLKLVQVQVVARHCARTPVQIVPHEAEQKYVWNCPHYSSNTVLGKQELENLGELEKMDLPHFVPYRVRMMIREDDKDMLGNCIRGQLTLGGIKGCYQIGQEIRDRYFNPASKFFLGETFEQFDADKMYVRCTDVNTRRTEHSAIYMVRCFFFNVLHCDYVVVWHILFNLLIFNVTIVFFFVVVVILLFFF